MCRAKQECLAHIDTANWATVKFFELEQFQFTIKKLGNTFTTTTAFGEGSHRPKKAAIAFSNRRSEDMLRQACPAGLHRLIAQMWPGRCLFRCLSQPDIVSCMNVKANKQRGRWCN